MDSPTDNARYSSNEIKFFGDRYLGNIENYVDDLYTDTVHSRYLPNNMDALGIDANSNRDFKVSLTSGFTIVPYASLQSPVGVSLNDYLLWNMIRMEVCI